MVKNLSLIKYLIKEHFSVIGFILTYFILLACKIIYFKTPFYNWDESIYVQAGREMMRKHFFLAPLWQGQVWLDKPPLPSLLYGFLGTVIPIEPEITTRILSLLISVIILLLAYIFYSRVIGNKNIALLSVVITAFIPAFLQRAQIVNVDIFLLLGWMGYVVFFNNFLLGLIFLTISVLSKSLLGFYPPLIFILFFSVRLYLKQISKDEYKKKIMSIILQMVIVSLWFVVMFVFYQNSFWKMHFVESHFKRVAASIESHFGKRTYYIDLLFNELGIFAYLSILGGGLIVYDFIRNKKIDKFFMSLFFVPWFLFLNLTKTKIDWYIYPILFQFAFLASYALIIFKKNRQLLLTLILIIIILYQNVEGNKLFNVRYSSVDENYKMAIYAKENCQKINYLVNSDTRKTYDTLNKMNLTITTTSWWGDNPRIVYYSNRPVNFIYMKDVFSRNMSQIRDECFVAYKQDIDDTINSGNYKVTKKFNDLLLLKLEK